MRQKLAVVLLLRNFAFSRTRTKKIRWDKHHFRYRHFSVTFFAVYPTWPKAQFERIAKAKIAPILLWLMPNLFLFQLIFCWLWQPAYLFAKNLSIKILIIHYTVVYYNLSCNSWLFGNNKSWWCQHLQYLSGRWKNRTVYAPSLAHHCKRKVFTKMFQFWT